MKDNGGRMGSARSGIHPSRRLRPCELPCRVRRRKDRCIVSSSWVGASRSYVILLAKGLLHPTCSLSRTGASPDMLLGANDHSINDLGRQLVNLSSESYEDNWKM